MLACIALLASCNKKKTETPNEESKSELQQKVEEYAYFDLTADLSKLTESERKLLPIFFEIGQIMDGLKTVEKVGRQYTSSYGRQRCWKVIVP